MNHLKHGLLLITFILGLACNITYASSNNCLHVTLDNQELQIDQSVEGAMSSAKMNREDFFSTLRIVARYETNGCWAGATGNFDGQLLSAGVMQWNFGQGSLQPIIKKFSEKFSSQAQFEKIRDKLMPKYGIKLFDKSCRAIPIGKTCYVFLSGLRHGKNGELNDDFKNEVDSLFNSQPMRQIQVDIFARNLTKVLSDLDRVFQTPKPKSWQVAWAMDIKTQQGNKFPTDKNIKAIKRQIESASLLERERHISGVVKWYEGLCDSGTSEGIRYDCSYNVNTWSGMAPQVIKEADKEETVHFTHLVSRTAQNQDGAYQANAFQRRATIIFGRGSVNGSKVDFSTSM